VLVLFSTDAVADRLMARVEAGARSTFRPETTYDAVIVLAHTGLGRPPGAGDADPSNEDVGRRIAQEVPGIDVLILGHTHAVIDSARVGSTLVTQAGRWAEGLGRVDLTFTRAAGAPAGPGGAAGPARWTLATRRSRVIAVIDIRAAVESERSRRRHERMARVLRRAGVHVLTWQERALPGAAEVRSTLMPLIEPPVALAQRGTSSRPMPLIPVAEMEEIVAEGDHRIAELDTVQQDPVPSGFYDDELELTAIR